MRIDVCLVRTLGGQVGRGETAEGDPPSLSKNHRPPRLPRRRKGLGKKGDPKRFQRGASKRDGSPERAITSPIAFGMEDDPRAKGILEKTVGSRRAYLHPRPKVTGAGVLPLNASVFGSVT
jgi:hypothetical protein